MTRKPYSSYPPELAANFVEQFEGFEERAYRDPVGVLTIGFGHTGADVKEGDTISYQEGYTLLVKDLKKHVTALAPFVNVPVTEGQFIALTSLAFNVGSVPSKCPKLLRALNTGDTEGAAEEFLDVVKAKGKVLPGLVRRRKAEAKLFLEGME